MRFSLVFSWIPKTILYLFLLNFSAFFLPDSAWAFNNLSTVQAPNSCDLALVKVDLATQPLKANVVCANGVRVCGEDLYPLEAVLKHLDLNEEWLLHAGQKGIKLLSLGEGYSPLLPYLRERDIEAYGVDLTYGRLSEIPDNAGKAKLVEYIKKWGRFLFPTAPDQLPFANETFDALLSHQVFNNPMPEDVIEKMMNESMRVLKPGGELRIVGLNSAALESFNKVALTNGIGTFECWSFTNSWKLPGLMTRNSMQSILCRLIKKS